jgi:hypothetical protein
MSNNLLQVTLTTTRAEISLSCATGNDSELVRQLGNRISQMEKDLFGIHAMAGEKEMRARCSRTICFR